MSAGIELWYYTQGHRAAGPVTFQTLQRLANSGDLAPDDLCWREGLKDWTPVRDLTPQSGSSALSHVASAPPA